MEIVMEQKRQAEKASSQKDETIAMLSKMLQNHKKQAISEIEALKTKVRETEQQQLFGNNDGSETNLLRTELNEKKRQHAAVTEQYLATAKSCREAQLEVQKLMQERLLLFDHIRKMGAATQIDYQKQQQQTIASLQAQQNSQASFGRGNKN